MPDERFQFSISAETTEAFENQLPCDRRFGADLKFLGVVRHLEDGRELSGIDYTCYDPMARQMLQTLCEEMTTADSNHRVLIHHRIGFVAAGEPSLLIRVQAPHTAEGFALCQEYLKRIKKTVPIWKNPVFIDRMEPAAAEPGTSPTV